MKIISAEINKNKRIIYLDDLPRWESGRFKGKIDWKNSVGFNVKCIYYGKEFIVKIISYKSNKRRQYLTIIYNNKEFEILIDNFAKCHMGKVFGKRTSEFKVEIGTYYKDDKRDLIITDREVRKDENGKRWKWYKYTCNKCGWTDGWIEEGHLQGSRKRGCACCCLSPSKSVYGINSIVDTAPWMVEYFENPEEAKIYCKGSGKEITVICPDCGRVKKMRILDLYHYGMSCFCGDGKSYSEKFMVNTLSQLNIKFEIEYFPDWIKPYKRRYDFYFKYNNEKYIIETHGKQHYKGGFETCGGRNLEEEQANDKLKKELALQNDIKEENYIVIDCRYSELDWVKDNVSNSKLNVIFDLDSINWIRVGEFACKNFIKEVCKTKKDNPRLSTSDIGKIMGIKSCTVNKYLKQGTKLGWCDYDPKEERIKGCRKAGKSLGKQVKIFKDGIELGEYPSCAELERCSIKDFGIKLGNGSIGLVCNGKQKQYKGFTFQYI